MSLSLGIVGLPNVGKSTLFNALTQKSVPAENYPFCTIDPSVGVVAVPDERLERLNDFSKSKKKVPAAVEFVDIAGLVKGAAEGEGLGNKFLANIRETDAIAHIVRIFEDENVQHVHGKIHPLEDIEVINLELILADQETVAKRLSSVEKEVRSGDKNAAIEKDMLERVKKALAEGRLANSVPLSEEELPLLRALQLLTAKKMLYVLNKKHGGVNLDEMKDERWNTLMKFLTEVNAVWVVVDAALEMELSSMNAEEQVEFRRELGAVDSGVNALIRAGYDLLGLITFFTTGEDETRGWQIKKDSTAPEAGAAIHSDFREKFIKAEVVFWEKLLEAGSYGAARERGWVRTEGKEYIVKDGDVIEFKI